MPPDRRPPRPPDQAVDLGGGAQLQAEQALRGPWLRGDAAVSDPAEPTGRDVHHSGLLAELHPQRFGDTILGQLPRRLEARRLANA
jgi:hypothetical protein